MNFKRITNLLLSSMLAAVMVISGPASAMAATANEEQIEIEVEEDDLNEEQEIVVEDEGESEEIIDFTTGQETNKEDPVSEIVAPEIDKIDSEEEGDNVIEVPELEIAPGISTFAISYSDAREYDGLSWAIKTNCVLFARYMVPSLPSGLNTLNDKKKIINTNTPSAGAIAVTPGNSIAGHVAYVESVSGNQVTLLHGGFADANGNLTGIIKRTRGTAQEQSILGYFHPGGGAGQTVNDGDFVNNGGKIYRIAGGAPIYVTSWNAFGGAKPYKDLTNAQFAALRQYPTAGTYLRGVPTGHIYRVANGGHYYHIRSWADVGGAKAYTDVDEAGMGHSLNGNPMGSLDSVVGGTGTVRVGGWAWDNNLNHGSLDIHVYIGGPAGSASAQGFNIGKANINRKDVNSAYPGASGNYGFNKTLTTSKRGSQTVYVYAINAGGTSGSNALIGTRTVTIGTPSGSSTPSTSSRPITKVALNRSTASLNVGSTVTLTSTITPSNTTSNKTITWSSNNNKVATISGGKVTAVSSGKATITAKTTNGKTATCVITVTKLSSPKGGTWKRDSKGWWYQWSNGSYPKNKWEQISGKWYRFDSRGYMRTGWVKLSGKWYYLYGGNNGSRATGWVKVSNKWYYFDAKNSGAMVTGWRNIGGKRYHFKGGDNGSMSTGWLKFGDKWYYLYGGNNGSMAKGWIKTGNNWYYLTSSGAMATNQWIGKDYVGKDGKWIRR